MKKFFTLLACISFVACSQIDDLSDKENVLGGNHEDDGLGNESEIVVSGLVQKGQFSKGAQVTIFGLNEKLQATGYSWPSNIKDASGSFSITIEKGSPYLELRAQGYYFNELTGLTSDGTMTLEAIVESSSNRVNVNLLTHLVRLRIKYLMTEGYTYVQARTQAENELITSLGYSALGVSFDQLDITKSREGDALLLALACALQYGHTTGGMVTFINTLSLDFEKDGTIEESNLAKIETVKSNINIGEVYDNMQEYYRKNDMAESVVPEFYRYLLDPDTFVVEGIEGVEKSFSYTGGETEINVMSMTDLTLESNVDWIEISKEHVAHVQYKVRLKVLQNEAFEDRSGKVVLKDAKGDTRAEYDITQQGAYKLIECTIGPDTKSLFMDDDLTLRIIGDDWVDVNGKDYPVYGNGDRKFTVRAELAPSYVVSYPADAVESMTDGTFSVNYPYEVPNNTYTISMGVAEGSECRMEILNCLFSANLSNYPEWTHVELSVSGDVAICGKAMVTSDYNVISVIEGKSTIRVNRAGDESVVYIPVIPSNIQELEFTIYSAGGKLYSRSYSKPTPIDLKRGYMMKLGSL